MPPARATVSRRWTPEAEEEGLPIVSGSPSHCFFLERERHRKSGPPPHQRHDAAASEQPYDDLHDAERPGPGGCLHRRKPSDSKYRRPGLRVSRFTLKWCLVVLFCPLVTYLILLAIFGSLCAGQRSGLAPKLPCSIYDHWKTLRRHNLFDLRIDAGLGGQITTFATTRNVREGIQESKNARILVTGLVSNAESSLPSMTQDLDMLLSHLPNAHVVVCESCSR